eukprot:9049637-Pyramimonas_sp.AAC.1
MLRGKHTHPPRARRDPIAGPSPTRDHRRHGRDVPVGAAASRAVEGPCGGPRAASAGVAPVRARAT